MYYQSVGSGCRASAMLRVEFVVSRIPPGEEQCSPDTQMWSSLCYHNLPHDMLKDSLIRGGTATHRESQMARIMMSTLRATSPRLSAEEHRRLSDLQHHVSNAPSLFLSASSSRPGSAAHEGGQERNKGRAWKDQNSRHAQSVLPAEERSIG